jgi:signal peptidase I
MRWLRRLGGVAVSTALLVGCGGGAGGSNAVRDAASRYIAALEHRQASAVCASVTPSYWQAMRQDFEAGLEESQGALSQDCLAALDHVFALERGAPLVRTKIAVEDVHVAGRRASAAFSSQGRTEPVQLQEADDGSWRISCCVGSQLNQAATQTLRVPSGSMEPTLQIGQHVTVDNRAFATAPPKVGEIVDFHPPAGADPADAACGDHDQGTGHRQACDEPTTGVSAQLFIKRIMAGPGDTIRILNGQVIRNGVPERDPYARRCGGPDCNFPRSITIPAGEYFVLGDDRGQSDDSRFWGPIKRSWILGLVTP